MGKREKKENCGLWLVSLNKFFKKHWFWYTIILVLPSAWFAVILPYGGELCGLQYNNSLTRLGFVTSIIIVILVAVISFLNNSVMKRAEQEEMESIKGNAEYLSTIMNSIDRICDEKCTRLENKIVDVKVKNVKSAEIISNPSNQLRRISVGIKECLVKLLSNAETEFAFKDFFVTIAYNFPQENKEWQWVEGTTESAMTLEKLLDADSRSTFNHLIKTKQPYYFNNQKERACAEHKYMYNPQDELCAENGEPMGSIFCYCYRIFKGGTSYVDAMLSISTQKKRFAKETKEANVRNNMIALMKDSFGKRIEIELSLLYLEYLKMKEEAKE